MTMKTIARAMILVVSLVSTARAADVEGLWQTPDDGGVVKVEACADALCGHIVTSDQIKKNPAQTDARNQDERLRGRPLKGMALFYGLKGGPTEWAGGSVYNPQDGKTYHGSIKLVGADTLKLTGCVFYPLCKSETWTRIK